MKTIYFGHSRAYDYQNELYWNVNLIIKNG